MRGDARASSRASSVVVRLSPDVPATLNNPCSVRHMNSEKLMCPCQRDCVPTGSSTSPPFVGCPDGQTTLQVPFSWFILRDAGGTEYEFNYQVPAGQNHLFWKMGGGGFCAAIPHYLLTRIKERVSDDPQRISYGWVLNVTWTPVGPQAQPRVTAVKDGDDRGVTLTYDPDPIPRLRYIDDPYGRRHTVSYTSILSEDANVSYNQVTGIQVLGFGTPRTVHNWAFSYRNPSDPSQRG
jgi:hypothetical protein